MREQLDDLLIQINEVKTNEELVRCIEEALACDVEDAEIANALKISYDDLDSLMTGEVEIKNVGKAKRILMALVQKERRKYKIIYYNQ